MTDSTIVNSPSLANDGLLNSEQSVIGKKVFLTSSAVLYLFSFKFYKAFVIVEGLKRPYGPNMIDLGIQHPSGETFLNCSLVHSLFQLFKINIYICLCAGASENLMDCK